MLLSLDLIDRKLWRHQGAFVMIQDIFEAFPVAECSAWFQFIDENVDALNKIGNQNTAAVRAFAGLMKRLSKTTDVVFSGKILMSLSQVFRPSSIHPKGIAK